jgi:hypothetical protein
MREWRVSGLSVRAFCAEQGLSEASFYAWRRTLAERDAAAVKFVPVRIASEPRSPMTTSVSAGAAVSTSGDAVPTAVELVLGGGRRLRIGPGFDGPTLARLLALLEEGRP